MNSIKFFVAVLLLFFSTQSVALFMPADEQIDFEKTKVSNNVGC
jgi:hypothetical protein